MKKYTLQEVLSSSRIGFEFEFLIEMDAIKAARSLSDTLGVRVVVPMNVDKLNKETVKYHTPIIPTETIFKLESDYSGGKQCHELITGPLPYTDARNILINTFDWIKKNGRTTDRCSVHMNVSFDPNKIKLKTDITHVNVLKFCLLFDEKRIYKEFPKRENSIYAKSIKHLLTNNIFQLSPSSNQLKTPDEKYYGINFLKAAKNYLEFRYLGSEDYEKRSQVVLENMDYFISFLFTILEHPGMNDVSYSKIEKILKEHKKYLDVYKDPMLLKKLFPDIHLTFDLKQDDLLLKTYWNSIKDKIVMLLLHGGVSVGNINYDSDLSMIQLKDGKFNNGCVKDIELVNCVGYGSFTNCKLYNCNMSQTMMVDCHLIANNEISDSKIQNCNVDKSNILENCYIENGDNKKIIDCEVNGGVFRKGTQGKNIKISKETCTIEFNELKNDMTKLKNVGVYITPDKNNHKQQQVLIITKKK
jgi:hypothetical protein